MMDVSQTEDEMKQAAVVKAAVNTAIHTGLNSKSLTPKEAIAK